MGHETIVVVDDGETVEIALNRPERANAINKKMEEELFAELDKAESNPQVRSIIVRGNGKHFCSGGDMYQAAAGHGKTRDANPARVRDSIRDLAIWQNYRKPIIMAVHGYLGAQAVRWMLNVDLTVATPDARISYAGLRNGRAPATIVSALTIGHKKLKEWQMLAGTLSGEEAERHGLINKVVPMDQLYPTARAWARTIAAIPVDVVMVNKHLINQVYEMFGSPTHYHLSNLGNRVSHDSPMDDEFYRRISQDGLKPALLWRDSQKDSSNLDLDAVPTRN